MTGPNPKIPKETLAARKRLIEIYKDAQRQLSKSLTSATLTDFQEFRIREQLQQIDAIVAALNASVKKALPGVVESYYKYGADLGSAALQAQGVKVAALNLGNRIHTAAVQAVAEQMALDLAGANSSMKTEATRILRQTQQALLEEFQINKDIAQGVVQGETRRQTSARLRDQFKDRLKDEQFITIKGRNYTPEYYSELVTRTRTREAVTEGAKRRGLEYGITEFQVSIHDNPCPRCAAVQGKVYSVRDDSEFPKLTPEVTPPIHPHCRHVLVSYIRRPGEKGDRQHKALVEASNADAPLAENSSGYEEALAKANEIGNVRKKRLPGEGNTKTVADTITHELPEKAKFAVQVEKDLIKANEEWQSAEFGTKKWNAASKRVDDINEKRKEAYQDLWDSRANGETDKYNGIIPEALQETIDSRAKASGVDRWVESVYDGGKTEATEKLRSAVDGSEAFMAVRAPGLQTALKDGEFKNSLQTGKGTFGLRGEQRATEERAFLGVTASPQEAERYPKYGFMSAPGMKNRKVSAYGDIYVQFNKERIKDRTTITLGDSLNKNIGDTIATPAPLNDVDYRLLSSFSKTDPSGGFAKKAKSFESIEDFASSSYVEAQFYGKLETSAIQQIYVVTDEAKAEVEAMLTDAGLDIPVLIVEL